MKHTLTFILLLCWSCLFAQSLKKADKDFEIGNFAIALDTYLKLTEKDPSNGYISQQIADIYRISGQFQMAENWYLKASNQTGSSPSNLLNLGNVQKMLGKYKEAKEIYKRFAYTNPGVGKHFEASCDFALEMLNNPSPYVVRPEYINDTHDDFGPAPYESHIVFSTTKPVETDSDKTSLVISSLDQNSFLKPSTPLRSEFDHIAGEGPLTYSSVANLVFYSKNNFKEGLRHIPESGMAMSLFYALLDGDGGWTEVKPFPFNGSGYSSGFPSLSEDGKTLFFASDRPDGYGGWDIYVSRKIGDTWTTPENLGPMVNTNGNEISPFFDGTELFFASDWHHGLGGYDIFKATRKDTEWNNIYHLGAAVNSSADDFGFVYHPQNQIAYFSSNRSGGKGNLDLYRAQRQTDVIAISIKNALGEPVENAVIDLTACNEGSYRSDLNGNYRFQALGGFYCDAVISKTGYTQQNLQLSSSGNQQQLNFEVVLTKEPEKIQGVVFNGATNGAEGEVLVRATNQNTGGILETYTANDGSYHLALEPNSVYVIRYSKVGFTDAHNRISTTSQVDQAILGIVTFDPVYADVISSPEPPVSANSEDMEREKPVEASPVSPDSGKALFAVQVGAVATTSTVDLSSFNNLKGIGKVYLVEEKNMNKIRVGPFKTKAAADFAKKRINSIGYNEAFVVGQSADIAVTTPEPETKTPPPSTAKTCCNGFSFGGATNET